MNYIQSLIKLGDQTKFQEGINFNFMGQKTYLTQLNINWWLENILITSGTIGLT